MNIAEYLRWCAVHGDQEQAIKAMEQGADVIDKLETLEGAIAKEREAWQSQIERLREALEQAADIADSFQCGHCGMDGKAGAAIRAALEAKP